MNCGMRSRGVRTLWIVVLCLVSLASVPALAQTAATGNIEGVIADSSGGVLPGVTVTIRNMDTNVTRVLVTDGEGRYRAAALQPGRYEVLAELSGFTAKPITDVTVSVGQVVPVDLRLQPAGVTETVSVTTDAPLLDTTRTDVSNVIGQDTIRNLPINGRRWDNFVLLSPGVSNDGNFGLVSYRGISGLYNNNMVDGVDNNQAFFSEARGRTRAVYSISSASIKEFQVGISNMSAEFGRAAGGTVNAVTKSGTNTITGEGFYFLRDRAFQAQDPFITDSEWDQTDETRQQFGFAVGGPVTRDKVFFFGSYDQQVRSFPPFVRPSQTSFFNTCTASATNCAATTSFYQSLQVTSDREANNKVSLIKVDWAMNPANNFAFSYNGQRWDSPNGINTQAVLFLAESYNGTDIVKTDFAVANWNSIISQRWLNEFRLQIGRDNEQQTPNGVGPATTATNGINFGMPNFLPRYKYPFETRYQFLDSVTYYTGAHTIKSGFDLNFIQEEIHNLFQGGGVYSYSGLSTVAMDCPADARPIGCVPSGARNYTTYNQAFDNNGLGGALTFNSATYAFYVQDMWRVNDRMLVNLGLRYDYQALPQPGDVETDGVLFAGNPAVPETQSFNKDKTNWAPRLGLTYDLGARHDTVLRASYGIFYGLTSNSAVSNALLNNGINLVTYSFTPTTAGAPIYPATLAAPPAGAVGARPDIQYFATDLVRPRVHSIDIGVEQRLNSDMTFTASYLNSRGRHLPYFRDINFPVANSTVRYVLESGGLLGTFPLYRGTRPNANFGRITVMESTVDTDYNAMVLELRRRFNGGMMFNMNYTLAKSEDNGQTSTTFFSNNQAYDGPTGRSNDVDGVMVTSSNDRRHRFVGSFHYQPEYLWGIGVGGILTLESGLPLTPLITGSLPAGFGSTFSSTTNGTGGSTVAPWLGFNSDRQTGRKTFDIRAAKEFNLGGRARAQVLWEVFNLFNTENYGTFGQTAFAVVSASSTYDAGANVGTVVLRPDAGYLQPTTASSYAWGPRDMQLGLRLFW
jgi:outer membrane receptor protein involved in Fe transport